MSQSPHDPTHPPAPLPSTLQSYAPGQPFEPGPTLIVPAEAAGKTPWLLLGVALLAAAGLAASALLWQKVSNMQEELARRSTDSGAQAVEARTLARQAEEATRELAARLALQDTRISEVSLQRTQLEELMQSLSRSRDENLVVDFESALRLAQQQAQLTGSAEPLLAALRSADQRLQRAAQPRLNPLQRAIAKDMERIKAASLTDVPVLLIKIDELVRLADELPLANAMPVTGAARVAPAPAPLPAASAPSAGRTAASAPLPASPGVATPVEKLLAYLTPATWFQSILNNVKGEAGKLLRVSSIKEPEAALLAPEQSFFLRENFKLRLLNARLSLLSRQTEAARSDLVAANGWLVKYFDANSRKTQSAAQSLQQIQAQIKTSELPRLDETMAALATAAAGR
jgi:uroporphyrin-III C-methyltransferase